MTEFKEWWDWFLYEHERIDPDWAKVLKQSEIIAQEGWNAAIRHMEKRAEEKDPRHWLRTVLSHIKHTLYVWDESNPGPGNSWDDCCTDMKEQIEMLRYIDNKYSNLSDYKQEG